MASPQLEDGHIKIANSIIDKFCSYRLSGQEWQVLWVVIRKTWGWLEDINNKNGLKKKMDNIPLSQFAEITGIDRRKCHVLLGKLADKKIIKKIVTQKDDKKTIKYGFQKDFDQWLVSPKKVTVTQKDDKKPITNGYNKTLNNDLQKGEPLSLSPKKVTKLSPKKTPSKERKKTTVKFKKIPVKKEKTFSDKISDFVRSFNSFISEKYPKQVPNKTKPEIWFQNSAGVIDEMIRLDGYELDYIKSVIRWALKDSFWKKNLYSLAGLRRVKEDGRTKFQKISASFDTMPVKEKPKTKIFIPVEGVFDGGGS